MGNSLLFAAPEPSYHPLEYAGELLWIPRSGHEEALDQGIPCLLLRRGDASHLLLYFHANSEDLGMIYVQLRYLRSLLAVHVLAVEYAGYGLCSGTPSEESLLSDADEVLSYVQESLQVGVQHILAMGRSLGSGPAIYLASSRRLAGLVTVAAFSSVSEVVGSTARMLGWFVDIFDNGARIRSVSCPTLIIHGSDDEIVPVEQARMLASACGAALGAERPKPRLTILRGTGHNNFDMKQDIVSSVKKAFPSLTGGCPLWPRSWPEDLLRRQPQRLASDVCARVPFPPGWSPAKPPFGSIRIFGKDGDEI